MKKLALYLLSFLFCVACDQVKLSEIKKNDTIQTQPRGNNPNADKVWAYITESPVVNWQLDYSVSPKDVPDFAHKNVLRGELSLTNQTCSIR